MPRFRVLAACAISLGAVLLAVALSKAVPTLAWAWSGGGLGLARAEPGASEPPWLLKHRDYVAQATLLIIPTSCTGFVAGRPDQIVTAAHCIPVGVRRVEVSAHGKRYVARLDRLDRDTDLALLRLDHPLAVLPLSLSPKLPKPGEHVLFVGRSDRTRNVQIATVKKLARCPSLPKVPKALFTSLNAQPGDSGAPLVDARLRVVGLVHGGARCHIAAPVAPLAEQLEAEQQEQEMPVEAKREGAGYAPSRSLVSEAKIIERHIERASAARGAVELPLKAHEVAGVGGADRCTVSQLRP